MICNYFSEPLYIFFTTDLPPLLYYSHIPASVVALIVAAFLFAHNRKALLNQLFLLITLCFLGWTTINLYVWTNIHSEYMIFVWPFFGVLAALYQFFPSIL